MATLHSGDMVDGSSASSTQPAQVYGRCWQLHSGCFIVMHAHASRHRRSGRIVRGSSGTEPCAWLLPMLRDIRQGSSTLWTSQ